MRSCIWAFAALFSFLSFVQVDRAHSSALLADLENALMCTCDDKCGKVLINCTCDTSDKIRIGFTEQLESGLTVQQIIQEQVAKHGESVLSTPTKSGFNITAWAMPFVALVAGGLGIRKIIQTWAGRNRENAGSEKETEAEKPAKYSSRLQKELDKLDS